MNSDPKRQLPRGQVICLLAAAMVAMLARRGDAAPEDLPPPTAKSEAAVVWRDRCQTCHGATGKGDGPGAAALEPRPRDLTQASWQSSVTDEHIEKIIAEGGQGVGLSLLMPANPDLVPKPDVIKALREHVRSLAVP